MINLSPTNKGTAALIYISCMHAIILQIRRQLHQQ